MELLNNIWQALTTPNEILINILSFPFIIIETTILMLLFISLLDIKTKAKFKIYYVILISIISLLSNYFIPTPFHLIINYISMLLAIHFIFNLDILKTLIAFILPIIIFSLIGMCIAPAFLFAFNISSNDLLNIPIYRIAYILVQYSIAFIIYLIFKYKVIVFNIFGNIQKKHKQIIFANIIFGVFNILFQAIIAIYYIDNLPLYIMFLTFISMFGYFSLSLYSLTRIMKLALTTQKLENAEEYNRTLTILHDSVRGFKHDFDNIVTTIGGYIKTNDMDGLKKYYLQLSDDCQKVNNLYILNPEAINNPGVYSLLTTKYHLAEENGIKITMSLLLNLNSLNMKIYEFTRILGILLDNAIEASKECEEKLINIIFRDDDKHHRQLVIIENTYKDKSVDTNMIFNKGYSGKDNHTGLGLWEVKNILNKNKNISLYTTKNTKYFSQQLEIYY